MDAIYFSACTASTLGLGDVVPKTSALVIVALLEALGGFVLLSASITYFLSMCRELLRSQETAAGRALTAVLMAHYQYPVLHYFRSPRDDRALPLQVGRLIRLHRMIRDDAPEGRLVTLAHHPSFAALFASVQQYVREVEDLFVPARVRLDGPVPEDAAEVDHRRMLAYLMYL